MTKRKDESAQAVLSLTCKRLESAEANLTAALRRLSALDAEIVDLCIESAQSALAPGEERSFAAVEFVRRMAALRIEELRRRRTSIEIECEKARDETRRLLRQKIGLEEALSAAAGEARRRMRHR